MTSSGAITGQRKQLTAPTTFMPVQIPSGLPSLGTTSLGRGAKMTVYGPGSFLVAGINLNRDSRLFIDNSRGPVTLYVTGTVYQAEAPG